jgi:hypothetical protein
MGGKEVIGADEKRFKRFVYGFAGALWIVMLGLWWKADTSALSVSEVGHRFPAGTVGYIFAATILVALLILTRRFVAALCWGLLFLLFGGMYLLSPML